MTPPPYPPLWKTVRVWLKPELQKWWSNPITAMRDCEGFWLLQHSIERYKPDDVVKWKLEGGDTMTDEEVCSLTGFELDRMICNFLYGDTKRSNCPRYSEKMEYVGKILLLATVKLNLIVTVFKDKDGKFEASAMGADDFIAIENTIPMAICRAIIGTIKAERIVDMT